MEDFNKASSSYDKQFSFTSIGKAQREQVWKYTDSLNIPNDSSILEVNCGTGEDANLWQKRGSTILATDISSGMLNVARQKFPHIHFQQLDVNQLGELQLSYDVLFSNFGGLNCLAQEELKAFFTHAHGKLNENGKLILIIMGKKCWWDKLFLILKGKWSIRNRRNANEALSINVDGTTVKTWYYSPTEVKQLAQGQFEVELLKPVGLFVPPSYLANYFEKKKGLLNLLKFLDRIFSFSFLSNRADHYFICITKIPSSIR